MRNSRQTLALLGLILAGGVVAAVAFLSGDTESNTVQPSVAALPEDSSADERESPPDNEGDPSQEVQFPDAETVPDRTEDQPVEDSPAEEPTEEVEEEPTEVCHQSATLKWLETAAKEHKQWGTLEWGSDSTAAVEANALAVLTYLGMGHCHEHGEFREVVRNGLRALRAMQKNDGAFGENGDVRSHSLAMLALSDAYGMSADAALLAVVARSTTWLLKARTPESGWGLVERDSNPDVISTAMAVVALKTVLLAGVEADKDDTTTAMREAYEFADSLTTVHGDRAWTNGTARQSAAVGPGGRFLPHILPICEAAYAVVASMSGLHDKSEAAKARFSAAINALTLPEHLPSAEAGKVDLMYWWLGTLAAFSHGGFRANGWFNAAKDALGKLREGTSPGDEINFGSIAATDPWSHHSNRLVATTLATRTETLLAIMEHMPD